MKPAIILVALTGIVCSSGCQSLLNQSVMEQRVVEQFADAVREENEPALRRIASSRFEQKALRSEDVLRDLRVLRLPTGELSVVEVKDIDEGHREVVVKEESGGKYQFHLVLDKQKSYWTVDDVVMRQRTKGTQVTKSTTEVMDLLMTLREFLDVWEGGSREEIMAMTSPDLAASLSPLPDEWLQALTNRIASTYEEGMARKPEANLNVDHAVVKLPSKNGHLMISIVRESEQWFIDDVEAHNHREKNHPGSIRRQADAMNVVNGFLTSYAAEDSNSLKQMTTQQFYSTSLDVADLSLVELPQPAEVPAEFDIRAYENRLTFMLPAGREIVRLDLEEQINEIPDVVREELGRDKNMGPRFLVNDVTLYEKATKRQRSLSAVFTAPTRASLFLQALAQRDHQILSQVSTTDLAEGTWKRASPEMLKEVPIPQFFDNGLKLTSSHSIGERTELEFQNGQGMVMSCSMINQNGLLKVADVQYPNDTGQVTSLKTQLELAIPVIEFSSAWAANDLNLLQRACSSDFNRLVWSHLKGVPGRYASLPARLQAPIVETRVTQERATVRFGNNSGIPVAANLIVEHGYWVVDEIHLDEGQGNVVAVREALRSQISSQLLSGSYSTVHSDDGFQVVMPVQPSTQPMNAPVDMTPNPNNSDTSEESFSRWANLGETQTAGQSGVRQASAEFAAETNRGQVDHAVYHRYQNGGADSSSLQVTPAVRTRVLEDPATGVPNRLPGDDGMMKFDRNLNGHRPLPQAIHPARNVQAFGPEADQILQQMDTTPAAQPASVTPTDGGRGDGMLRFGPQTKTVPKKLKGTATPPVIRQPADAPISID